MSKILVLGGSRYFGKRLVNLLLREGKHEVTVATRGLTEVSFDGPVRSLTLNRTDVQDLKKPPKPAHGMLFTTTSVIRLMKRWLL